MRKFLALALSLVLLISGSAVLITGAPRSFEPQARAATGAIFVDADRRFECSGTEIAHTKDGDGIFLTARHCVASVETNKITRRMQLSFSDNMGGPYYDAVPIAISTSDDLALLLVRNGASIPEVKIKDERRLRGGDPIFNVSYPLGAGKLIFHGEYLAPRFPMFPGILADYPMWQFAMPANITWAHGSSGSGVFSSGQRALIAVCVGTFSEGSFNVAIPADRVLDFLADLSDNTVERFALQNPEKEEVEVF